MPSFGARKPLDRTWTFSFAQGQGILHEWGEGDKERGGCSLLLNPRSTCDCFLTIKIWILPYRATTAISGALVAQPRWPAFVYRSLRVYVSSKLRKRPHQQRAIETSGRPAGAARQSRRCREASRRDDVSAARRRGKRRNVRCQLALIGQRKLSHTYCLGKLHSSACVLCQINGQSAVDRTREKIQQLVNSATINEKKKKK